MIYQGKYFDSNNFFTYAGKNGKTQPHYRCGFCEHIVTVKSRSNHLKHKHSEVLR
ncbi:MAG: hypothetical protein AMDU2_EPLC00005G0366 [Thermoplasmatales archaeon E-plasma]|jgi:hypothetical protein|nr:MAG: hypothetical protein AMDU2_EPLC00005G0366 [Thermoplasmatales archaeon E-plasma]